MIALAVAAAASDRPGGRAHDVAARRIEGIDLARALAILGMLAIHVGPTEAEGVAGTLYALPHGRAAILFGVLAGVGVSLLAASRTASRSHARVTLAWRALVLLPLGLALQPLDHGVFVILQDYALLFVVGLLLLAVRGGWLLALAGVVTAAGSLGHLWGLVAAPAAFERQAAAWGDSVAELAHRLVLSGPYPLITWAGPFLFGMWLGRRDLRSGRTRQRMLLGGAIVALSAVVASWLLTTVLGLPAEPDGWGRIVVASPHSQMPLWLISTTGSAAMALGACLLVADRLGRVVWPLVAVGQLAFTVYVGHVLALDAFPEALTADEVAPATGLVLGFTLAAMALATVWRALLRRGPLELLLHLPSVVWPSRADEPSGRPP